MVSIEKFIDDVVDEVKEQTELEKVCINGILDHYPEDFEGAVETCSWNTMYWDNPSDLPEDLKEMFVIRDYEEISGI